MLPPIYIITDNVTDPLTFESNIDACLGHSSAFIQIRLKSLSVKDYSCYLSSACQLAGPNAHRLLLNTGAFACLADALSTCLDSSAGGVHLVSKDLMSSDTKEVLNQFKQQWTKPYPPIIAASCHSKEQLKRAQLLDLNFVVVSPVLPSITCPSDNYLGWDGFHDIITEADNLPVYALGGLDGSHLATSRKYGAQGIAAINAFWNKHNFITQ
ncbi:hypothetical protein K7432_012160 [Basidiobolus ranarum]|uniref:Thiamine phosphate synthase/TenI domain-containing protein n=1 Tax=Basidiobolus ranarum TaxID=34480 RepID=A0ABR2WLB7_9FUNG